MQIKTAFGMRGNFLRLWLERLEEQNTASREELKKDSKDKSLVARAALELKRVQEMLLSGQSSKQCKGESPSSRLKLPKCPPPHVTPLGKKDKKECDQLQRHCS